MTISRPRSAWRRLFLWLGVITASCLAITAYCSYRVVTLAKEASALKEAFVSNVHRQSISPQVQLSVGPGLLQIAHWIAARTGEVDAETLGLLRTVKSASVGVYSCDSRLREDPLVLQRCNDQMAKRGWRRVVNVRDSHSTVVAYAPAGLARAKTLRACVAVLDGDQLVIVSGEVDGAQLLPLVERELTSHRLRKAELVMKD